MKTQTDLLVPFPFPISLFPRLLLLIVSQGGAARRAGAGAAAPPLPQAEPARHRHQEPLPSVRVYVGAPGGDERLFRSICLCFCVVSPYLYAVCQHCGRFNFVCVIIRFNFNTKPTPLSRASLLVVFLVEC
jgi:hypothetical protein